MAIPRDFYKLHKFVTLTADVMFVCGIPFLVTHLRGIKCFTGEFLPGRKAGQSANSLRKVIYLYAKGGYVVNACLMDREFETVRKHLPLVEVDVTAAREHVPEIESGIRRMREKTRACTSEFKHRWIPTLLLVHTVYTMVFWLNAFVNGSENYGFSPRTLVTGLLTNHARDCKAAPGEYLEAEVDPDVTNTNDPRTRACVCLGPSGNRQGSVKCLDLETNKTVYRSVANVDPMPDDIIRKVNALGKKGAHAIERGNVTFRNRNGEKFSIWWSNLSQRRCILILSLIHI